MSTFNAGRFRMETNTGGQQWDLTLDYNGVVQETLRLIRYDELVDLRFVINRAIAEAERRMPGTTA